MRSMEYVKEEGLVRFATVKYDTSHKQLWNPCMHLCNYSINKYHSDYIKSDDPCAENVGHKWTLSALLRHLQSQGKDTVQLMAQIEDIVVKAIITSANSIISWAESSRGDSPSETGEITVCTTWCLGTSIPYVRLLVSLFTVLRSIVRYTDISDTESDI
ncbi:Tubulin tyrosine ligase-like 5 [Carabus blaptoides fortunei]